ncbi:aminotransferase class I/II-fold pyridoxal phosphate-dependent enzyme [Fusibacter bizertensis]
MRLLKALELIKSDNLISYHMPGHKNGHHVPEVFQEILKYDITEIPGSDHLHDAKGCILETECLISRLYNSEKSKLLINGSTVGILSMIMGLTGRGDKVLVNRNAHKSIYNALEMNGLNPIYIYPEVDDFLGIPTDLKLDEIEDVKICILTYPTYEGLCYSIKDIIALCHSKGIPVIVDEAHGAHLFLHDQGPKSSLELGADVVVQSFHKTLPAMTQSACIHIGKNHILSDFQLERLDWYLKTLQSSSPSYVLMASVDAMLTVVEQQGKALSQELEFNIEAFYKRADHLKHLKFIRLKNGDITKLLLSIPLDNFFPDYWDGHVISQMLREKYRIQSEYDTATLVLFMTSISTSKDDFEALNIALERLDQWFEVSLADKFNLDNSDVIDKTMGKYNVVYRTIERENNFVYSASDAVLMNKKTVNREDCIGCIAAEYIIPYPPGIPILVPGERITKAVVNLFPKEVNEVKIIIEIAEVYNE